MSTVHVPYVPAAANSSRPPSLDFATRPVVVIWEVTQACDLACAHCRACAQPLRDALELTTEEGKRLIDQVSELGAPVFVLTGGDPLKRNDIYDLARYARDCGLRPALSPSATPLLTRDAILKLKQAGIFRLALSLDGSCAERHDRQRKVAGSFAKTLEAIHDAHLCGLPVQINTTVTRSTLDDFDAIAQLVQQLGIVLWSVFFVVPTGRAAHTEMLSAFETDAVFRKLHDLAPRVKFHIKTTEAPHYRRYLKQANAAAEAAATEGAPAIHVGSGFHGINDAKGFVFVSHRGDVCPSGFLPLAAGNVRQQSLTEIYRHSPLFVSLRDASRLKGKCGACEFRELCGGSRARAYAVTGDPFAEEPTCIYEPHSADGHRDSTGTGAGQAFPGLSLDSGNSLQ
jgi:radical SAM protein